MILAENNSNDLVNLEVEAFNAMEGRFRDENVEYTINREPDQSLAIGLLHSPEYHQTCRNRAATGEELFVVLRYLRRSSGGYRC